MTQVRNKPTWVMILFFIIATISYYLFGEVPIVPRDHNHYYYIPSPNSQKTIRPRDEVIMMKPMMKL